MIPNEIPPFLITLKLFLSHHLWIVDMIHSYDDGTA